MQSPSSGQRNRSVLSFAWSCSWSYKRLLAPSKSHPLSDSPLDSHSFQRNRQNDPSNISPSTDPLPTPPLSHLPFNSIIIPVLSLRVPIPRDATNKMIHQMPLRRNTLSTYRIPPALIARPVSRPFFALGLDGIPARQQQRGTLDSAEACMPGARAIECVCARPDVLLARFWGSGWRSAGSYGYRWW